MRWDFGTTPGWHCFLPTPTAAENRCSKCLLSAPPSAGLRERGALRTPQRRDPVLTAEEEVVRVICVKFIYVSEQVTVDPCDS